MVGVKGKHLDPLGRRVTNLRLMTAARNSGKECISRDWTSKRVKRLLVLGQAPRWLNHKTPMRRESVLSIVQKTGNKATG